MAHVNWNPPERVSLGGLFYTIRIQQGDYENPERDKVLQLPITPEQRKKQRVEWCIGRVAEFIGAVED